MAWTKAKTALVAGAAVLLAGGAALTFTEIYQHLGGFLRGQQSDAVTFQGTWSGREVAANRAGTASLLFDGTNFEFHGADSREWYKATFTLREDTTPRQLVAVITDCPFPQYVGQSSYAIYQVEGNTLTFAGNEPGRPLPPSSFDAAGARKFVFTKK